MAMHKNMYNKVTCPKDLTWFFILCTLVFTHMFGPTIYVATRMLCNSNMKEISKNTLFNV